MITNLAASVPALRPRIRKQLPDQIIGILSIYPLHHGQSPTVVLPCSMDSPPASPCYKKPVVRFETVLCLVDTALNELFNGVEIAEALGSDYGTLRDNTFDAFEDLLTKLDYDQPVTPKVLSDISGLQSSVSNAIDDTRRVESVEDRVESFWRAHQTFMQLMFQSHVSYLRCVALSESITIPFTAVDSVHAVVNGSVCGKRARKQ
jgi:hypothetical protein